jgi:hypothetical protein
MAGPAMSARTSDDMANSTARLVTILFISSSSFEVFKVYGDILR